jgi:hypothetical protein
MPYTLALPEPGALRPKAARMAREPDQLEQFRPGDAGRAPIESFITQAFLQTYGAQVSHFSDTLIGCRGADGEWIAALGYSLAASGPTFLEQYLDAPLEVEIGKRLGYPVARAQIVEVGNLAATSHPGAARALIVRTTALLYHMGLHLVAFTATPSLLNSFGRLRLQPQLLAPADPSRLPGAGRQWGSYYDNQPQVMFGDIRYGYEKLARLPSP